ncbi:MAG: endo-1,4-beta-xylanase [Chitinispirillaceae bacterium]|nr:endo-1,4-beta-xylanase [Chitinispirillaceae bacterium]
MLKPFYLLLVCFIITADAQESLRKYADSLGLNIGVAIRESYITGTGSSATTHNNIVKTEFNTVVCENAMKSQNLAYSKTTYNFSTADNVVDFAIANKMKIRGHTLVWYRQNAQWLISGDREMLLANMKYHIEKVMGHYRGKIYQWDVVNEPFDEAGSGKFRTDNNPWQTVIGEDYIDSAFVYAHAADPGCKLYINEFGTTFPGPKSEALYDKVKEMLDNGIPVHGVGFQCHEGAVEDTVAAGLYAGIKYNFNRFAELGLDLAVTELDIQSSDPKAQADNYRVYLQVALSFPQCRTFVIWGVSDKDSWRSSGTPLIYDGNFKPKPAYDALLAVLKDPTPVVLVDRRARRLTKAGYLVYDRANNTVRVNDPSSNGPAIMEMFDLRGARIAKVTLRANNPLPLSSMKTAPGTALIRVKDEVVRIARDK